jgi:site-specific recombinase XerD
MEDFLSFSGRACFEPDSATKEHIALWIKDLSERPHPRPTGEVVIGERAGLSNSTIHQRVTAVRLYQDYLVEEGLRERNPVSRGVRRGGRGKGKRGLVGRYQKLPWIPNETQWQALLNVINTLTLRNRLMFALSYDCAVRREELCLVRVEDFDETHYTLRIRAETTKSKTERVVIYSANTAALLSLYIARSRPWSSRIGLLFLSESRRNYGTPISYWTWSKVMKAVAELSGLSKLTTHTLRHLRLTDLARDGWDLREIAEFAGHRNLETTRLYIHLSGRDLKTKLTRGMESIHAWRESTLKRLSA